MTDKINEFEKLYGEAALEELTEAICNYNYGRNKTYGRITITELEYQDVINCQGEAYLQHGDDEIYLTFECGNWNGLVIKDFGDDATYKPMEHRMLVLKLDENNLSEKELELARLIFEQRKTEIKQLAFNMQYDLHFCPTEKIKNHYKEALLKFSIPLVQEWAEARA